MITDMGAIARELERIADALELITDKKKRTLRMVDVERGKVYKTHLGQRLSQSEQPTTAENNPK